MTRVTVKVDAGEVRSVIDRATLAMERLPQRVIRREIEQARDEARDYPPPLPWQRYRRTGTYYRSFRIELVRRGYRLSSDARQRGRRYTKYVGGLADGSAQASIHRGRWTLIYHAVLAAQQRIVERSREYFRSVLERNGAP